MESLNHRGFATTTPGLAPYSLDCAKGSGLMQCWYPDTSTVATETNVVQLDTTILSRILKVLSVFQYHSSIYSASMKTMIK